MKSPSWCLAILAAGLVLVGGLNLSAFGSSNRKGRKPAKTPPVAVKQAEEVVDGYGSTARDARARALENAQERVTELLRQKAGDPQWHPPAELLEPGYLEGKGVIAEVGKPEPSGDDKALVARYKVQLTDEYIRHAQQLARHERVLERHLCLARVLGGIVAVLLVTAGFLRLEEMTRGYATQLLRLAAFALLAVTGVAIWLTLP
jgi:hypothetical protein